MSLLKSNYLILKEQKLIVEYHSGILDPIHLLISKKALL